MQLYIETPEGFPNSYVEEVLIIPRKGDKVRVNYVSGGTKALMVTDVVFDYTDNSVTITVDTPEF